MFIRCQECLTGEGGPFQHILQHEEKRKEGRMKERKKETNNPI
jgi:hypothetical protein